MGRLKGEKMEDKSSVIFRKQALERITAPEQLTDYLKVTNPGIWALLAAIVFLLVGLVVWSTVGSLETVVDGVAIVENGQGMVMASDTSRGEIATGMTVRVGQQEFTVAAVQNDEYGRAVGLSPMELANGRYDVTIVTESIHPIRFLLD